MQQEFTINKGWKIFLFPVVLLVSILIFGELLNSHAQNLGLVIVCLMALLGCWWVAISLVKCRIVVSESFITHTNAFKTTNIRLSEIKGIQVGKKAIRIEHWSPAKTSITIVNYTFYGAGNQLTEWLQTSFANLNTAGTKQNQEQY